MTPFLISPIDRSRVSFRFAPEKISKTSKKSKKERKVPKKWLYTCLSPVRRAERKENRLRGQTVVERVDDVCPEDHLRPATAREASRKNVAEKYQKLG